MRKLILILLIFLSYRGFSQELLCQVQINKSQIQGTSEKIFQSLQTSITEFMNNRNWTNNVYSNSERIECQLFINLSEYNGIDKFKGTITIQSTRPVYGTNYKSVLLNHKEKDNLFSFEYIEQQSLEFNENTYTSNLTSVLAFYAYVIIGLDYDSFGLNGGAPYFQKAQTIVNTAQSSPDAGWKAYEVSDESNRYYLAENLVNTTNAPLHKFYYRFHRLGLDRMTDKTEIARTEIVESIKFIQATFKAKPNSFLLKMVLTSKLDEIVKIFSEAPMLQKKEVYNMLKEIDPSSQKIDKILEEPKN